LSRTANEKRTRPVRLEPACASAAVREGAQRIVRKQDARVSSAAIRTIRVSRGKTSRVSAAQSLVGLIAVGHRCVRWCVRGSAFATSRAHLSQVGVAKTKASCSRKGGLLRTQQFYLTQPHVNRRDVRELDLCVTYCRHGEWCPREHIVRRRGNSCASRERRRTGRQPCAPSRIECRRRNCRLCVVVPYHTMDTDGMRPLGISCCRTLSTRLRRRMHAGKGSREAAFHRGLAAGPD